MCEHCENSQNNMQNDKDKDALRRDKLFRMRHSASHIMAEAVKAIFPDAKFAIGPAIADGFYYDFDLPRPLTDDDLKTISDKMKEIIKANVPFEHSEMSKDEAKKVFADQPYKLELIDGIKDENVSIYKQNTFTDLCAGPHVRRTGECKHFKLTSVAGAYWRGDASKPMLQRIYGTVWPTKAELDAYLAIQEEAKKRDHRKLGKELDLFFMHPYAPGAIFWQPKGYTIYKELHNYWSEIQRAEGYIEIYNPLMYDAELYKTSGHWDHYQDAMFKLDVDEKTMCLKPMNCPDTMLFFKQHKHSYRELPLRVAERQVLHRNELSGALSGLTRVRQFMQDDAHLFVAPEQIEGEISRLLNIIANHYKLFDLSYKFYLSTRPDDFMGDIELWNKAEDALARALTQNHIDYHLKPKDGAFYGPKIDIALTDSLGRQIQCATIQLDFQLPERFQLEYVTADNTVARPVVIHRAIFGSYERFIGILIEHLAGVFPTWLAPVQVAILPITDAFVPYAKSISQMLENAGIRTFLDDRSEKIGYKIRQSEMQKVPYMLVIGQKEVDQNQVNVRTYKDGERGVMSPEELKNEVLDRIQNRTLDVNIKKLDIDAFIHPEDVDAEEREY